MFKRIRAALERRQQRKRIRRWMEENSPHSLPLLTYPETRYAADPLNPASPLWIGHAEGAEPEPYPNCNIPPAEAADTFTGAPFLDSGSRWEPSADATGYSDSGCSSSSNDSW